MSVISFKEIHDGRDYDGRTEDGRTTRNYTRVWRAVTNSNTDDGNTIRAYVDCPTEGDQHNTDTDAYCVGVTASNQSFSKRVWLVTAEYSTITPTPSPSGPLNDAAVVEWDSATEQQTFTYIPLEHDGSHLILPVVNTAFEPFDPMPTKNFSWRVATVTKNVSGIPTWLFNYADCVNSAPFTLDGETIPALAAKVSHVKVSPPQERQEQSYRVVTLALEIQRLFCVDPSAGSMNFEGVIVKPITDAGGNLDFAVINLAPSAITATVSPWDTLVLSAGFSEIGPNDQLQQITTGKKGEETYPTSPHPLNMAGKALKLPIQAADLTFIWYPRFRVSFAGLPLT